MSNKRNNKRQELDINNSIVLLLALICTVITYIVLFPFQNTFIGILLYQRGITQYIVIFFAYIVGVLTLLKFLKIREELAVLKKIVIPENISFDDLQSRQIVNLQQSLLQNNSLVAIRCWRIIRVYLLSGNKKNATEFALDDSSFYLTASESSYSFPRIIVWAIPLLGFIGTVIGISSAVNGFSGFLEKAGEIDQIREGIGTVTSGLAVAFDTTLLALFLSVLVMIPLVLVERLESKLLLGIDIYINDKILSRFKDNDYNSSREELDKLTIEEVIKDTVKKNLPSTEVLIKPAEEYAKVVASQLTENFIKEINLVQEMGAKLISEIGQVSQNNIKDRQDFLTFFEQQRENNNNLLGEIKLLIQTISEHNNEIKLGFEQQTSTVSLHLEKAAASLENRIKALEKCTANLTPIVDLQNSLDQSLRTLEKTAQLKNVLTQVQDNLAELKPVLQQLNKPRRITLIESDDRNL
jgi:biopolymer transport protein ExbB/TolQ